MIPASEMTGEVFGKLTVTGKHLKRIGKRKRIAWDCVCECGQTLIVITGSLRAGNIKTCGSIGCRWTRFDLNHPMGVLRANLATLRYRAKSRGRKFDIDLEHLWQLWEDQNGKCALTGIPMTVIKGKGYVDTNISIDRIDSIQGYEIGNVQLVCYRVNSMKSAMKTEKFIEFCSMVAAYNLGEK